MNNDPTPAEQTTATHEVVLTLRRYRIAVPDAELSHVIAAHGVVRGLADLLAAVPDLALVGLGDELGDRRARAQGTA